MSSGTNNLEDFQQFLKKFKIHLPCDLCTTYLSKVNKTLYLHTDFRQLFMATSFIVAPNWKPCKCPSSRWMYRQVLAYSYSEVQFCITRELVRWKYILEIELYPACARSWVLSPALQSVNQPTSDTWRTVNHKVFFIFFLASLWFKIHS